MKSFSRLLISIIVVTSVCFATTINVPSDQPTIQTGINVADEGDLVLVSEGVYFENINFKGKAITVASRFLYDGKRDHIKNTIIDGSKFLHPDSGSVVYFVNGETTNSVLCGFTITGGSGTKSYPLLDGRCGGGIFAESSGACIKHNIIESNTVHYYDNTIGGGIYVWQLNNQGLIIEGNIIRNNHLISDDNSVYSLGAGIYANSIGSDQIHIANNVIMYNTISALFAWGGGIVPANWGDAVYFIVNNIISSNRVDASIFGGSGGIDMFGHIPVTRNNVIANNFAPYGGGINIEFVPPAEEEVSATLEKSVVNGLKRSKLKLLKKKRLSSETEIAALSNNTLVGNSSSLFGGGVAVSGIEPQLINLIIWDNSAPDGPQISGTPDVQYSVVEGGYSGTGNLDENPLLFSSLLLPGFKSPCIDAGNPNPAYNDPAIRPHSRRALLPSRRTIHNDIGAYGGPGAADWWKFWTFIKEFELLKFEKGNYFSENQKKTIKINEFPNPFNNQTTIRFELPEENLVRLNIYNILGQEVACLVNGRLNAGTHQYIWNADKVASGVYFYRLEANGEIFQNKLILLK